MSRTDFLRLQDLDLSIPVWERKNEPESLSGKPRIYFIDWGITPAGYMALGLCERTDRVCKIALGEMAFFVGRISKNFFCDDQICEEDTRCLDFSCDLNKSNDGSILKMLGLVDDRKPTNDSREDERAKIVCIIKSFTERVNEQRRLQKQ